VQKLSQESSVRKNSSQGEGVFIDGSVVNSNSILLISFVSRV
jgi:hypothetical protein